MISSTRALSEWFEQFGLPVFLEADVPDGAELPYITIPLRDPPWDGQCSFPVSVWYRTTTNLPLLEIASSILSVVGTGTRIPFEQGLLVLRQDTDVPTQEMVDGDFRSVTIMFTLNSYHLPGV